MIVSMVNGSVARVKKCLDTTELLLRFISAVETLSPDQTLKVFLVDKLKIQESDEVRGRELNDMECLVTVNNPPPLLLRNKPVIT